jgi:hypothetical protein
VSGGRLPLEFLPLFIPWIQDEVLVRLYLEPFADNGQFQADPRRTTDIDMVEADRSRHRRATGWIVGYRERLAVFLRSKM